MKPRVLIVTFTKLAPANHGNARRVMQLLGLYQRHGYEVDLVYHQEEGFDAGLSAKLAARFGRVAVVRSHNRKLIGPDHACRIVDWYDTGLDAAVRDMHRLRDYQVVHVNYVWYTPVLAQFGPGVVKVIDTHDVFAERARKHTDAGLPPMWFSTSIAEEDAALRLADAALAIQKEEAAELVARGLTNIVYLPYVEPCERSFTPPDGRRPLTFGYLGSNNEWNIRSMNDFVRAIQRRAGELPHPVLVAGGICKHLLDCPGVMKLGFVKELHTFYDAIDIAINPMVGGTGLKIKTVEPLSFGKPVITTPSGAQGLAHLWTLPVFDDPAALVDHLYSAYPPDKPEAVAALFALGESSRQALDAEYDHQVDGFFKWLEARI